MNLRCPNCAVPFEFGEETEFNSISCPSCYSKFDLVDDTDTTADIGQSNFVIAHYDVLQVLGAGNFGRVLKARDSELDRFVAIKVPHRERLTPREVEFFFREARAASQLNHPNVVTVFEVGRFDDSVYIASEFVDGLTLNEWTKIRKPSVHSAVEVCKTIAEAVEHGHQKGIVHRDLKPSNVLIDGEDQPHVADFGLAKRDGFEATIALDGRILGTPAYMPPEQAAGKGNDADARSDVYSIGVILYEMLVGRRPFIGGRRVLLHQVMHDPPESLRSIRKEVPRDLENICLKCLEKSPSRRYSSAGELAEDLERFLAGQPVFARQISIPERAIRWFRRNPSRGLAISFAGLSAVLIGILLGVAQFPSIAEGSRLVLIEDVDPNTSLLFVPIDPQNGLPDPSKSIPGKSKNRPTRLLPGDYVVVASNGERFHEVYRFVPPQDQELPEVWPQRSWSMKGDIVVLPAIQLFANQDLAPWMAKVDGGSFKTVFNGSDVRTVEIESFYVDRLEWGLPSEEYQPLTGINWYEACDLAEQQGKRLLTDSEFSYLVTKGGATPFPWGDRPPTAEEFRQIPVDQRRNDVLSWERVDREVFNLYSNVLEWTASVPTIGDGRDQAIIRGGPILPSAEVISSGQVTLDEPERRLYTTASANDRLIRNKMTNHPGLGCRFARSTKPIERP